MHGPTLQVARVLHAGYVFECDGTRLLFDPIFENPFSTNCHAFPPLRFDHERLARERFDAVFISHFHDDHCSLDSLVRLDRDTPIYLYCVFAELAEWIRALGFSRVFSLAIDVPVSIGPFVVWPRRALDAEVDSLFHVEAAGLKVLNVVDSWIDEETLSTLAGVGPWDLVLWPFQTMRELEVLSPSRAPAAPAGLPPEWLPQLRALRPRFVVPSSCQFEMEPWSWYNHAFFPITYRQFGAEVSAALPACGLVRLNPGVSVRLDAHGLTPAPPLPWIFPLSEPNVDYDYQPRRQPPSTAEIAQHFAPLSAEQTERVLAYCQTGLLERYRTLEPPEAPYFRKPRLWRLSVYDHEGAATHFTYRLHRGRIEPSALGAAPLAWTTEVPIARLHGALACGEQLTSMYLRINDVRFEPAVEKDLAGVEPVDDPLVRCLFEGVFGAFQAAQLQRLSRSG